MERSKRRKLKFPCLFGGIEENPRHKSVQSWSPNNATAEQSMFKFEVGKGPSKQHKSKPTHNLSARGISNETSDEKCSPGILAKLMGRGAQQRRLSNNVSKNVLSTMDFKAETEDLVANQLHSSRTSAKVSDVEIRRNVVFNENIDINDINRRLKEGYENGRINLFEYGYLEDDSLHVYTSGSTSSELEVIETTSRITIDINDRLTHSLSNIFERSLVTEAKNRISERWKTTGGNEHVERANKGSTLREILSFPNEEMRPEVLMSVTDLVKVNDMVKGNANDEVDADEKVVVYSEPLKRSNGEEISLPNVGYDKKSHSSQPSKIFSTETSFENEGPAKYQPSVSNVDDYNDTTYAAFLFDAVSGSNKIETSLETLKNKLNENVGSRMMDANSSRVDETSHIYELSRRRSESREGLKDDVLESPSSEDALSDPESYEKLNSRLQEIRKQIHMMKVQSRLPSQDLKLTPKVKQLRQGSSGAIPASGIYGIDHDTFPPSYRSVHHPIDPRLFDRLEKYYFQEVVLSTSEKRLIHDYIEQTFIRTSKSMIAAYPWVNPAKREDQMTLKKLKIEDQMLKMIDEIDREDDQTVFEFNYDKDPEWVHPTNEIDILGKLIGDLVLNDLVLEFIEF